MTWDMVIGLEVHAQLSTKSKLFSGSATRFGASPNSQTSFLDAALPGTLPVLNAEAVQMAVQFGLATHATIDQSSVFERKNYFYPDLPKGYQISQYQRPIVHDAYIDVAVGDDIKRVDIVRAHLEEDAGKSLHDATPDHTGIDLNRAGTPLLEIVTSPCLYSTQEVIAYLKTLHQLVRFLGICDGNMQEGSFRCDVNLSLKPAGSSILGTRTELKNINSFRFIEKAIAYERARHEDILDQGGKIRQETRLYDPNIDRTVSMRSKENEQEYRYFPDPDLLPVIITDARIMAIKEAMPKLPAVISSELDLVAGLNQEDKAFILADPANYRFYEQVKSFGCADDKLIINWLKGSYTAWLNERQLGFTDAVVSAEDLAALLNKVSCKELSQHQAKQVFAELASGRSLIDALSNQDVAGDHSELEQWIAELIAKNPQQAAEYRAGKEKLLGFFVGQVMKHTKGQVDPELVNQLVLKGFVE